MMYFIPKIKRNRYLMYKKGVCIGWKEIRPTVRICQYNDGNELLTYRLSVNRNRNRKNSHLNRKNWHEVFSVLALLGHGSSRSWLFYVMVLLGLGSSRSWIYDRHIAEIPVARRELSVELGLCHCSRLPGKIDNQTDWGNTRIRGRSQWWWYG